MGQTAADTRREVEETREELGETIAELRDRGEQAKQTVRRRAPLVGVAALLVGGGAVATVLVLRSRRPEPTLMDRLAERVAEQQAQAERKANPIWRRPAAKALETAAVVAVGAGVRRLVGSREPTKV